MSDTKIRDLIHKVLKSDDRIWYESSSSDKTLELNYTLLLKLIEDIDEKIIDTLIKEKKLKEKFFVKTKSAYVFKSNDFRFFMEENKVDNSYTQYKNRIGLTDGKRFINDSNDIVLNFPYKDCILEGGQSTEEGMDTSFKYSEKTKKYETEKSKRKEIFFNQIIASDEIDRLFDEKAFVNWKRYTKKGEEKVKEIQRDENGIIKENLIIKGNNLLALHSMKKQFAGKVKLIYIDPPYNTKNDSFTYNDSFEHSTWLTFMKNRLEVARELLLEDGVIFVQCDDNEQAYLKVLMDEVFGRENFVNNIVREGKAGGGHDSKFLAVEFDYILVFAKKKPLLKFNRKRVDTSKDLKYQLIDGYVGRRGKYYLRDLDFKGGYSESLDYSISLSTGEEIFPGNKFGKPNTWRWSKTQLEWGIKNDFVVIDENKKKVYIKQYEFVDNKDNLRARYVPYRSLIKFLNTKGTQQVLNVTNDGGHLYPKPEELMQYIIDVSTQQNDIILDFHLGSGTTAAVAHKMGRQYIGIEQMEYIESIACKRLKKVLTGEQEGVSKSVNWQGGGDFIYLELAKWNEQAKGKIDACKNLMELVKLFNTLYEKYFLNYNIKLQEFKEKVIKEQNFMKLSLKDQKRIFLEMLDLNQMYVQKTEMADKKFGISKKDQELTNKFYSNKR